MARIIGKPTTELHITLELTYDEAKALEALAGYGTNPFVEAFFKVMGKAYLQPHVKGLASVFDVFRGLPSITDRYEKAQEVFAGTRIAVRSPPN